MLTGHLPELMIVLVLGLIVFGPKRLPEIGGAMGKGIRDFKKGLAQVGDEMEIHSEPVPEHADLQAAVPAELHPAVEPAVVSDVHAPRAV